MAIAPQSRSQIVTSLLMAFRRHGYDGASLSRLSEATGLRRASLYHHFPGGKEEMVRAVMASATNDFQNAVLTSLNGPGTAEQRLQCMTEALTTFYDGGKEACILALMTAGEGRETLAPEVRAGLEGWVGALTAVLTESGQPPALARARAEDAVIRVQGALVLARGLGDTLIFRRTVEELPRSLLD